MGRFNVMNPTLPLTAKTTSSPSPDPLLMLRRDGDEVREAGRVCSKHLEEATHRGKKAGDKKNILSS